jgi:rubrerythrin
MVDILTASALVAALVTVVTRRTAPATQASDGAGGAITLLPDIDLPCPWCGAQTREEDQRCPSCHQPFG